MAALPPPQVSLGDSFVPGTMLGKYELLATIGQGGMANVILARQRGPAGFEKVVVVKVIHPHMAQDKAAVDMLLDEARVAAQIDHPNVVHTYELGQAHGTFYIVMEYLAGEALSQILRVGRKSGAALNPLLAAKIVADAAEGLHAAHELKDFHGNRLEIVHRDVSPGNVVVLYNGTVKVVDFGIAKAHGRVTSTQDGVLKGKYSYMAPEQIRNEPMDRRSDVFSLGVVLWEALAHQRLFQADNVAATLMQVLGARRLPPSQHRPEVPPGLDAVTLRALDPDPARRFQSAADFKQAIDDVIWQSRCGTTEIQAYMTAMFSDRIEHRRSLLARAARDSLSDRDLELLASFRDDSVSHLVSAPAVPAPVAAPAKRRVWPIMLLGVVIGTLAGVIVYAGGDDPAKPAATVALSPQPEPMQSELAQPASPEPAAPAPEPAADPAAAAAEPAAESAAPAAEPAAEVTTAAPEARVVEDPPRRRPRAEDRTKPVARPKPAVTRPRPTPRDEQPSARKRASLGELYKQGTARYLGGDFAAAESSFKQALAISRTYAPAHRGLGFVYQRKGERARAILSLRRYLELSPKASDGAAIRKRIAQLGG